MEAILERARELKQSLLHFVMEAEGDLATSFEAYVADQLRSQSPDIKQRDLVVDAFLVEGKVKEKTALELFLESEPNLSEGDRHLVSSWKQSFIGLFAVTQVLSDGFELMNWLTAKHYIVKPNSLEKLEEMARFKPGEILLTRIAPVANGEWMFFGTYISKGNLGKPKLAVAIGNFKQDYKSSLYSDAPELLEEAWQSVEKYHQDFLNFFETDEVTMSGYELGKKISELQEVISQRYLAEAGIDSSKSLSEMAEEAGVDEDDIEMVAETVGVDSKVVSQMISNKNATKMVMPKVELPTELKKAKQVTVLAHPRWGQMFLPTYSQFKAALEVEGEDSQDAEKLSQRYLEDPNINTFVWHRLSEQHSIQLEKVLRKTLERPDFDIKQNLDNLLQEFNKPLEPELPEIASVPLHLHNLFQEALLEVNKSKSKGKGKKPLTKGFQR